MCTNQKMCGDRMEQNEALDVLSVGVALGDAGMLYNSSFRCIYQRQNTLEREEERPRNTACVPACVSVCYVSTHFG